MTPLDLAAVFAAGLLGSAHCVGMCGGFVVWLGAGARREVAARQAAYFGGKTATYALFGALAGAFGASLADLFGAFGGVVSVGLGAAMVGLGLGLCGVGWARGTAPGGRLAARLSSVIARLLASPRRGALVALGMVNGLLPCGLVYGMLAVAATTGGAATGALTMAVFGLGTVPALALTGVLGGRLRPTSRRRMQQLAGVLVVAIGVLTVARGASALTPGPAAAHHGVEVCLPTP